MHYYSTVHLYQIGFVSLQNVAPHHSLSALELGFAEDTGAIEV